MRGLRNSQVRCCDAACSAHERPSLGAPACEARPSSSAATASARCRLPTMAVLLTAPAIHRRLVIIVTEIGTRSSSAGETHPLHRAHEQPEATAALVSRRRLTIHATNALQSILSRPSLGWRTRQPQPQRRRHRHRHVGRLCRSSPRHHHFRQRGHRLGSPMGNDPRPAVMFHSVMTIKFAV